MTDAMGAGSSGRDMKRCRSSRKGSSSRVKSEKDVPGAARKRHEFEQLYPRKIEVPSFADQTRSPQY